MKIKHRSVSRQSMVVECHRQSSLNWQEQADACNAL